MASRSENHPHPVQREPKHRTGSAARRFDPLARSQLLVPVRRGFFGQGTTGGAQRPGVLRGGGRSLPTVRREQQWHRRHGSGNGFRSLFRSRGPARGGHLAQRQRTCIPPRNNETDLHALARPEIHLLRRHTQSDRQPGRRPTLHALARAHVIEFREPTSVGHPAAPRKMVQLPYRLSRRDRDTLPLHVLAERRDTRPHLAASPILDRPDTALLPTRRYVRAHLLSFQQSLTGPAS